MRGRCEGLPVDAGPCLGEFVANLLRIYCEFVWLATRIPGTMCLHLFLRRRRLGLSLSRSGSARPVRPHRRGLGLRGGRPGVEPALAGLRQLTPPRARVWALQLPNLVANLKLRI